MASIPSPLTRLEDLESKLKALSNDLQNDEAKTPTSLPSTVIKAIQGIEVGSAAPDQTHQAPVPAPVPLPAKYKVQQTDQKHMVQYVYASLRDPKDESIPAHVRERYKEIGKERRLGFPSAPVAVTATDNKPVIVSNNVPITVRKLTRPASANTERRRSPSYVQPRQASYRNESGAQMNFPAGAGPKPAPATHTKSSNAFVGIKQGRSRSQSKASAGSPRRRQPFSIAADSTSDTDPIDNHLSLEAIKSSPPRVARNRQARRQQYLAAKFKHVFKNSKHTQTIAPALSGLSLDDSSGSATTVISRRQSVTEAIPEDQAPQATSTQPDNVHTGHDSAPKSNEKPPISPSRERKDEPKDVDKEKIENAEWRRAKVRLRSTPGSPSPPPPPAVGGRQRVASADRMERSTADVTTSTGAAARPASAMAQVSLKTRPNSDGQLIAAVPNKQLTTSATQIDVSETKNEGVQVKIKKRKKHEKRSPSAKSVSHKSVSHRSVSQKSIGSKQSTKSKKVKEKGGAEKNAKKKKKKTKPVKSRDPSVKSVRSLRSGRSVQSAGQSTSKLRHVQISPRPSYHKSKRSASAGTFHDHTKKGKKKKKKSNLPSSSIARFLRQLSQDKEAIKIINKMAKAK